MNQSNTASSQSLYRQEALDAQSTQNHGRAVLLPSNRAWIISLCLFLWVGGMLLLLTQHSFSEKTTVYGYVRASAPSLAIHPKERTGMVSEILVEDGEFVQKGQALLRITRPNNMLLGAQNVEHQLSLLQQHVRLISQASAHKHKDLIEQQSHLIEQIASAEQRAQVLSRQREILAQRLALGESQLNRLTQLYKRNHLGINAIENAKQDHLNIQQQASNIDLQLADNKIRISQLNAQSANLEQQMLVQDTNSQINEIPVAQRLAEYSAQQSYVIKAPRAGRVSNLDVQLGDDVSRFPLLMKLTASESVFEVLLAVPSSAAGFVALEQAVRVRLDAFPHQKYGALKATINSVSDTITLPNESGMHAVPVDQASYLVKAQLEQSHILAKGKQVELKEGMTLQADVVLSRRSLLEWILAPLYSIRGSL
ncbi:HlyD family efflux transporter periplasmic adaptor subunit [Ningiella sp. W23]|uniref:HlyD family efflux transporter periplasmic adaptor subunit n=1 Tax=Ningiella sp. W23 TaxID=3023715 RepID=UPI003757822B